MKRSRSYKIIKRIDGARKPFVPARRLFSHDGSLLAEIPDPWRLTPGQTGAKELVRASLWEGRSVDIDGLLTDAESKYGQSFVPRTRHSLALSCMMAKRHDLARPLLLANIQHVPTTNAMWGKSVWALARMESLFDQAESARLYRLFSEEGSIPVRFRLQAQLLWCQALIAAGEPGPIMEARSMMETTLGNIQDPDVLMNFARQLQFGPRKGSVL